MKNEEIKEKIESVGLESAIENAVSASVIEDEYLRVLWNDCKVLLREINDHLYG